MTQDEVEQAANVILDACSAGRLIDGLPAECTPHDIEEAYAIQAAVFAGRRCAAEGWFAAASNPDMQRQLGLKEAYSARWGTGRFLENGARISSPGVLPVALEAEITFRLGRDLPPRDKSYEPAEVAQAIESAYPSFEVVISCFSDWMNQAPLNLIAEGGTAQYLVLGKPVREWRLLDLRSLAVTVRVNGLMAAQGKGGNVMSGQLNVMTWLANQASRRGIGLRRGDLCNTGMCTTVCFVEPGDHASADFAGLGEVHVIIRRGETQ